VISRFEKPGAFECGKLERGKRQRAKKKRQKEEMGKRGGIWNSGNQEAGAWLGSGFPAFHIGLLPWAWVPDFQI
jgi:hypothetical protein